MTDRETFQDLPHVKFTSPGAGPREQEMLGVLNEIQRRQQEAQASAFDAWARQHVPRLVREEMQRVRNLDLADRIKEWSAQDDEHDRLVRVLDCARHLLTVYDVTPGPGGFSRKSEPSQSPAAVDWWGELWCAVQAAGVVKSSAEVGAELDDVIRREQA